MEKPINIDWSKVDWSSSTSQTNFENLVQTIRWFWPYVNAESWGKSYPRLVHIIPLEYRFPTEREIDSFYPGLRGWNFLNIKMIFYEETYSDGVKKINYCTPYRFFSEFKPEEEK
jgi:hypothetical protein